MEKTNWRKIQVIERKELLELIGDKLNANEFEKLFNKVGYCDLYLEFDNDLRIKIQDKAKKVGKEISGNDFHNWLNGEVCILLNVSRK